MFGMKKLFGAYLDVVSELRSHGRGIGLMRLKAARNGSLCHINPYHIFAVMPHREGRNDAERYCHEPKTDIVLSATSIVVSEDIGYIVKTCRSLYGIPLVQLYVADMTGKEYYLNARKAITVFPDFDRADRCCVRTGKFHVICDEDAVKCAMRLNDAILKK